jgi:serine protease Do
VRIAGQLPIRIAGLLLAGVFLAAHAAERKASPAEVPDVVALTEQARRSVVVVTHYGRNGKQDGVGAGFVVARDGLIATCFHVIDEARPVTVELADGRRFDASEVYASDRKLDLAVVRIAATNLPVLKLGDSDSLKQGASVVAIGNPVGLELSVVQGVVSAKRDVEGIEMIQLAIPIESGNSGGPLLDARGRVQGLLNMKSVLTPNLGFAVPVNALKTLLDRPNPVPMARWLTIGALNPKEWLPVMGARWSRKAGRIEVEGQGTGFGGRSLCLWQKEFPSAPYELSVIVKLEDESGAAGLVFGSDGGEKHYGFYPTAGQMRLTRFDGPDVFSWTILKEFRTPHYKPGDWNTITVRVETNRIVGLVNDQRVLELGDHHVRGKVGLAKFRDTKAQFKKFSVGASAAPSSPLANDDERVALLERARKLDREAQDLRRAAATAHARATEAALVKALEGPDEKIDLFNAALLVSKLDNPEVDLASYRAELARMAEELKAALAANASDTTKVAAVTKYLFTDNGFHGSRTDYYNRANSYINEVMDDREGLPITLSVLFIELARGIGLTNVAGVPVPTRFMVAFHPTAGRQHLIDVFDNGKLITRSDAVELIAEAVDKVDEEDFRPATKKEIITRMLRNLLGVAQRSGTATDALRYLDAILAINPNSAGDRLARTRLQIQRGESAAAKVDLEWLIEHEPVGIDVERLTELYRSL